MAAGCHGASALQSECAAKRPSQSNPWPLGAQRLLERGLEHGPGGPAPTPGRNPPGRARFSELSSESSSGQAAPASNLPGRPRRCRAGPGPPPSRGGTTTHGKLGRRSQPPLASSPLGPLPPSAAAQSSMPGRAGPGAVAGDRTRSRRASADPKSTRAGRMLRVRVSIARSRRPGPAVVALSPPNLNSKRTRGRPAWSGRTVVV